MLVLAGLGSEKRAPVTGVYSDHRVESFRGNY